MGCCGSQPKQPDYAASERAGVLASANALPTQKLIENAAATGGTVTVGGKTYDFSGLGDAEVQAAYADAMAKAGLEIQRDLGDDYLAQREKELQLADPEGYAMRQQQWDRIMKMVGEAPNTADSKALSESVLRDLQKGGTLDPEVERQGRQKILGQQVKRGNWLGGAAATQEAKGMSALSDATRSDRVNRAMQFLSSGSTPEEAEYRKNLQDLGNLSAFTNSENPIAQFNSLSGAQNGAAPVNGSGTHGVGMNYNPGAGASWANQNASAQNSWASDQANPWLAGLGLGFQGAATLQSLRQ